MLTVQFEEREASAVIGLVREVGALPPWHQPDMLRFRGGELREAANRIETALDRHRWEKDAAARRLTRNHEQRALGWGTTMVPEERRGGPEVSKDAFDGRDLLVGRPEAGFRFALFNPVVDHGLGPSDHAPADPHRFWEGAPLHGRVCCSARKLDADRRDKVLMGFDAEGSNVETAS